MRMHEVVILTKSLLGGKLSDDICHVVKSCRFSCQEFCRLDGSLGKYCL